MIQLDVPRIFQVTGGPKGLLGLFDVYVPGHGLLYPTVQMWGSRRRIAGPWVPSVLFILTKLKLPLEDYFVMRDEEFG